MTRTGIEFHSLTPDRWPDLEHGPPPGLLAYHRTEPVGWCAVAPRESYVALERARSLKRVDGEPVWSARNPFR